MHVVLLVDSVVEKFVYRYGMVLSCRPADGHGPAVATRCSLLAAGNFLRSHVARGYAMGIFNVFLKNLA